MSFTLLDAFVVKGPEIKQYLRDTHLFLLLCAMLMFLPYNIHLLRGFEGTGFWFLILKFPLTGICLPLGMASPFGSAPLWIYGATLSFVILSSLQNKKIQNRTYFWVGN